MGEPKASFFGILTRFFAGFRKKKRSSGRNFESYSKFKQFLDETSDKEMYPYIERVIELCDEGLKDAKHRIILASRLQELDDRLKSLECFNKLTEDETKRIKNLLMSFTSMSKERNNLVAQLTEFDPSLAAIIGAEEDAIIAIGQIRDAETNQRILRSDLSILKGEKANMEYERETLQNNLDFVHKATIVAVTLFSLAALVLGYLSVFGGYDIFYPTSVMVLILIVLSAGAIWFRRKTVFELKINLKKQNKCVALINKKSVVFAYYTNFLKYEYKKYKVKSAQMLENNINNYSQYKHLTSRIDSIRKLMYETENEIEKFLVEKNIAHLKMSVENFSQAIDIDDKRMAYLELAKEKSEIERALSKLDNRHEAIWDELVMLNDKDKSEDRVIRKVIGFYLDEVSGLFETDDEEE